MESETRKGRQGLPESKWSCPRATARHSETARHSRVGRHRLSTLHTSACSGLNATSRAMSCGDRAEGVLAGALACGGERGGGDGAPRSSTATLLGSEGH